MAGQDTEATALVLGTQAGDIGIIGDGGGRIGDQQPHDTAAATTCAS